MKFNNFTYAPLGEYADVIDPHPSHRAPDEVKDGYPFLGIGDIDYFGKAAFDKVRHVALSVIEEHEKNYIIDDKTIGYAKMGNTIGKIVSFPDRKKQRYAVSSALSIINPKSNINPWYLRAVIESYEFWGQVNGKITGSTRPSIGIQQLRNVQIPIFALDTQRIIGGIWKAIYDKISLNNAINENLEQQAQALFKAWFVDFEPFGGVMPDDWQKSTLGDVSEMGAGGDKPQNATPTATLDNTVPIYSNGITDEGLYGFTDKAKIQDESVTVSARGTIGYVCLRQVPYVPIVRLVTLIPNKKIVSAKFLYHWLKTLHIAGTGTTQQQLTVPSFKKTEIIVPEYSIMEKFTVTINPLYEHILANKNQNQHLAALRDTLLPKLMNGEIDVSEVKI